MRRSNLVLAAFALLAMTAGAQAQDLRLRIGLITPPPHQWTRSAEALADRIEASTGGRITVSVHPSGQLGNEAQLLQQLQTGALDMAFLTVGEFTNRDADFGTLLAPYLVDGPAEAQALLQGPAALRLLAKTEALGLHGFGFGMAGMRQVLLAAPAGTGADLAGRKIRTVPLAQELDFWTRVGATPTPLPLPALYDAFANGQIDGMQIDFEGVWGSRYDRSGSELLASNHMMFPMVAVASARRWQALPEADRALIGAEVAAELDIILAAYQTLDTDYAARLQEAGVTVRRVDADFFGPAIADWYGAWREKTPFLLELEAEAAGL